MVERKVFSQTPRSAKYLHYSLSTVVFQWFILLFSQEVQPISDDLLEPWSHRPQVRPKKRASNWKQLLEKAQLELWWVILLLSKYFDTWPQSHEWFSSLH